MLELIMLLSLVMGKFSDLVVVGILLIINAVLSFVQEQRASGIIEALRKRLQITVRVHREAKWVVLPARELVPGDIVRVRAGDIVPADLKLLKGELTVDQSALTGESKGADKLPGDTLSSGSIATTWRRQLRGDTNWLKNLLWPHHGTGTKSNPEAAHRASYNKGRTLAFSYC